MKQKFLIFLALLQLALSFPEAPPVQKNPIKDVMASLPLTKMKELADNQLKEDPGFQAAVKYFLTPEWQEIVEGLRNAPQWIAYKDHLKNLSLDVNPVIEHFTHCLNATDASKLAVAPDTKPSLAKFIENVKKTMAIPVMQSVSQFTSKTAPQELQELFAKIASPETKALFEDALKTKEMQRMLKKLNELELNIDNGLTFMYALLGWETPKKFHEV